MKNRINITNGININILKHASIGEGHNYPLLMLIYCGDIPCFVPIITVGWLLSSLLHYSGNING